MTQVIRIITAVFLRETLEAANNDAEMMVQERLLQNARYVKKLEGRGGWCFKFYLADSSGKPFLDHFGIDKLEH